MKRKYSLVCRKLPKYDDTKKFARYLKQQDISYSKAKKVSGMKMAEIWFEDEESRELGKEKLKDFEVKGVSIVVHDKKERKQNNNYKRTPPPRPDSIADVVTPWHKDSYEEQLEKKNMEMKNILRKSTLSLKRKSKYNVPQWVKDLNNKQICSYDNIVPSPTINFYRNKNEFTIGFNEEEELTIGFLLGAFRDGFLETANPFECPNISEGAQLIRASIQTILESMPDYKPYLKSTHKGFWRLLVVRTTESGDAMVTLQVNPEDISQEELENIKQELTTKVLESNLSNNLNIKSFNLQLHNGMSNAAEYDAPLELLYGEPYIIENMLGLNFRISPSSFFQVNTKAAELLYTIVGDWCGDMDENTIVLDICCGTGTIGLTLANRVKKIIGVEMVESAVTDAIQNAKDNNIENVEFVVGKAEDVLKGVIESLPKDAKIIGVVDPPRSGLHGKTIKAIRECNNISKIIYVSCKQTSLVNDMADFCRSESKKMVGRPFIPLRSTAVDLFPHTPHCELIVEMERIPEEIQEELPEAQEELPETNEINDNTENAEAPTPDANSNPENTN
eukprot:TRINITY_DN9207_c0_g1_i1.p1 TRINITY_DN9207_c0_g1~~TRINITY_DN9207_c0_g1_i1.p1  ORF type:complete len:562 (-),score=159.92 TRINITY_DN9207_c0_g1_i1:33-1718(-)